MAIESAGFLERIVANLTGLPRYIHSLYDQFGVPTVLLGGLAAAGLLSWWHWSKIREKPGVIRLVDWLRRPLFRTAVPGVITVAIARLEGDPDRGCERALIDAFDGLRGIKLLRVPRVVRMPECPYVEEGATRAGLSAQKLLARTGAALLLWGTRLRPDDYVVRLRQTALPQVSNVTKSRRLSVADVDPPRELRTDIVGVVSVFLWRELSRIAAEWDGHFIVDKLDAGIGNMRQLLVNAPTDWTPVCRANLQCSLGYALTLRGEQAGCRESLVESIAVLRTSLTYHTRERGQGPWSIVLNNLGNALHALGKLETGNALLYEAAEAHGEVLREIRRAEVPPFWAMVTNNLAVVCNELAEREGGIQWIERSVALYEEVVQVWTREENPDDWALAQINLAAALYRLWQQTHEVHHARRAVHCCMEARKITHTRAPLRWASASNNAAIMMHAVSEHLSSDERRNLVVDAFEMFCDALRVRVRESVPLLWAESMSGLACVQYKLGKLDKDPERVNQGIQSLLQVLGEHRWERAPAEWITTQQRIARGYRLLDELEGKAHWLREALACYREILARLTVEEMPLLWATVTGSAGIVLHRLGEREQDISLLEEAAAAYEATLPIFVRHRSESISICEEKMSEVRDLLTQLRGSVDPVSDCQKTLEPISNSSATGRL